MSSAACLFALPHFIEAKRSSLSLSCEHAAYALYRLFVAEWRQFRETGSQEYSWEAKIEAMLAYVHMQT